MKFFKLRSFLGCVFLALAAAVSPVSAGEFTARVNAFQSANLPSLSPDLAFRFAALVGVDDASNQATHVLLQGLSPLAPASTVHVSNYSAINLASGQEQDAGVVFLDIADSQVPAGAVASPIVGVIQRSGSWSSLDPLTPSTTVGGSSGISTYNIEAGSISLSLARGGQVFSGTVDFRVADVDTILLDPFSLSDGSETFTFHESTLARDGGRFYGILESSDLAVTHDSLLHVLEFVNLPDSNDDGIPDLVRGGGCLPEGFAYHPLLTWVYSAGRCWTLWFASFNEDFGWVYTAFLDRATGGWMYHVEREWMFLWPLPQEPTMVPEFYVFLPESGWFVVTEDESGNVVYLPLDEDAT
ncbi:MAG: hypothetical protein JJT96_13960 [Opitutales bacterium]|nr:hypothetical protein [Opitutales bacterium]